MNFVLEMVKCAEENGAETGLVFKTGVVVMEGKCADLCF
jgi:hypothetical protein